MYIDRERNLHYERCTGMHRDDDCKCEEGIIYTHTHIYEVQVHEKAVYDGDWGGVHPSPRKFFPATASVYEITIMCG